jgi:hypothetical protein
VCLSAGTGIVALIMFRKAKTIEGDEKCHLTTIPSVPCVIHAPTFLCQKKKKKKEKKRKG